MTLTQAAAIPYVDLIGQHAPLRDELLDAVGRVLDHGQFILGPEVGELEQQWARRCAVKHAVGVSDGTTALMLVLKALGVAQGDEVITAPNSFVASVSCIVLVGATPRFADVGEDFNVDPDAVRRSITGRTRAIIAVHLAGRPAPMKELQAIAREHDLLVIEDAAQAMGAAYQGAPVGGLANAGCFSLHPLKTAGACGDAGMITTNNDELAEELRLLRNHGLTRRQEDCRRWGHNARLDTIQAAMAMVKLEHVDEWIRRRRANAEVYRGRLADLVDMPPDRAGDFVVYHTFPVQADRRDALVEHLQDAGIGCAVHYRRPIHLLEVADGLADAAGDLPMAEGQAARVISLPIHEGLDDGQIHRVCDAVAAFHT